MEGIRPMPRRSRLARGLVCVLVALLTMATLAPVAQSAGASTPTPTTGASEGNAFSELSSGAQQQETTSTAKPETTGSTGQASNSKKTVIIAVGAAIVLLIAIASVIVRDARRVAPAGDGALTEGRPGRDTAAAMRRRRARAKAAKRQRKRNR
ncbi:MAG: hypothetical protein QOF54_1105 [Solirubrobacteraceae bacterium]|nr:hypothetical protein [Solirubrobacteraceae bacterium]